MGPPGAPPFPRPPGMGPPPPGFQGCEPTFFFRAFVWQVFNTSLHV
jgi:hypothetical protein